ALTIVIISASYSQIIEQFPSGGGGYLVASKLLSPTAGMVSGCALIIDYVLTITVSIASGSDAIFSFLPAPFLAYKLWFAAVILVLLIILNLRGVKESVLVLMPIFLLFVISHLFMVIYALVAHPLSIATFVGSVHHDVTQTHSEIGYIGMFLIIIRAYSMGAGTYTGIEAVSNGLPVLREPRVKTAKRTMQYMAGSLLFMVVGLMTAYLIYSVEFVPGKTLNAVLFEKMTAGWGPAGYWAVGITLFAEAVLLFVAAQTGFVDGPRVLANMALDKWFPARFTNLSDRFVTQNGTVIMGLSALVFLILSQGSVQFLVVLYSINVFITFLLSQLGMVVHWWRRRTSLDRWRKGILINGIGLVLTVFILCSMIIIKFDEGGWITLIGTSVLIAVALGIRRHYRKTLKILHRLNDLVAAVAVEPVCNPTTQFDLNAKTAVLFVNGFNGLGLHTLFGIVRFFGPVFKNYIFVQVGVIDSGNFKGSEEIDNLEAMLQTESVKYVYYMRSQGYHADSITKVGTNVIDEVEEISPRICEKFSQAVFFGGQLVFPDESILSRWLHNFTTFAIQKKCYLKGVPFVMLPIRVDAK
ncbi:MAG: APC family permease, partial [Endomicrobiales bacterium]